MFFGPYKTAKRTDYRNEVVVFYGNTGGKTNINYNNFMNCCRDRRLERKKSPIKTDTKKLQLK